MKFTPDHILNPKAHAERVARGEHCRKERETAEAFLKKHPRSALLPVMLEDCGPVVVLGGERIKSAVALPGEHNTPPREKAVATTPARLPLIEPSFVKEIGEKALRLSERMFYGRKPRWVNIRALSEEEVKALTNA